MEDLHKGCISLFDDVDSEIDLSPTELNHAVRFLEYTILHVKYRRYPHNQLLETIFSKAEPPRTKLTSDLLKLICHPVHPLRTVSLSFLDVTFSQPTFNFDITKAVIELLPQLFEKLKPHEVPVNATTIDFHRHFTSILDGVFILSSAKIETIQPTTRILAFQPSLRYLRSLITRPVCPNDPRSGFMVLLDMKQFSSILATDRSHSSLHEVQQFFSEIRKEILEELASVLGIASPSEAEQYVNTYDHFVIDVNIWTKRFEFLLAQVSEGRQFSDLGIQAIMKFLFRRPQSVELFFWSDDTFGLKVNRTIVPSSKWDSQLLWTLFTPTRPHHTATIFEVFRQFVANMDQFTYVTHIWSRWFTHFVNAVDPSKLPFTSEFIPLHIELIYLMYDHLDKIEQYRVSWNRLLTNQLRTKLDEAYCDFFKQTKDYVVYLSLHPFALDDDQQNTILYCLSSVFQSNSDDSVSMQFRTEMRQEMDACDLSLSPPPFILTSELVCPLSDDEIISIVDRIVALLESDSCLDDDTILRICAFHKRKLRHIYLPELFRKAGRTTEQYFCAFESLLSLPIDSSDRSPLNYLLSPRPDRIQPTLDEWDDVDLEKLVIVKRVISQNHFSATSFSAGLFAAVQDFVTRSLPRIRHYATRLSQPQLERLIAPSVDILCTFFIRPKFDEIDEKESRKNTFINVCKLCDQRAIVQCLNRTGFFSRFVTGLVDDNFNTSSVYFDMIVGGFESFSIKQGDLKAIQGTVPHFLEEGWQDALEFIFVRKSFNFRDTQLNTSGMVQFFWGKCHVMGWI